MSINTNHTRNKITATENDLVLDTVDATSNINVSNNRITDLLDPVDLQDAVTKRFLTDQLNNIQGVLTQLSPQSPDNINLSTLSILNGQTYRITDFAQSDNTATGLSASAGQMVNNVLRSNDFSTNTLSTVGPGNSGNVQLLHNESIVSESTLDDSNNNGIVGSLIISNNVDYGTITGNPLGFHDVYNVNIIGEEAPEGWNNIRIRHALADSTESSTNTSVWYSDQSNTPSPAITNATITPSIATTGVLYSSTIPHYSSTQQFDITFDAANLSGDFYPASDTFILSAGVNNAAAVNALNNITYNDANITTPLPRNYLTNGTTTNITTITTIKNATGISTTNEGPALIVDNSYSTTRVDFPIAENVLYMSSSSVSVIHENNISVNAVGYGSGSAVRYETVDTDTPVDTSFLQFNSQSSTLNISDATIVGGVLTHDTTDYSNGYLPAGPDLSDGRASAQYIEFGFNRTAVSKFAIQWSGRISGCWVKIPGTSIDNTSTLNGWLDVRLPYEGIGIPGENTSANGNGTNGCGLAGVITTGSNVNNETINLTFGTESSSNATNNLILVRFKLQQGDSINSLTFKKAT